MNSKIFSPFTLNYYDAEYEKAYRIHSKNHTTQIFNFLYGYMLVALSIILGRNVFYMNWFSVVTTSSVAIFIIFTVTLVKRYEKESKSHIEIFVCLIVIFIYSTHLKFFFPPLFEILSPSELFYISAALESFRIFLYISKINWIYIVATNLFLNYLQYDMVLNAKRVENPNFLASILMFTLPVALYFQERSFRLLFYQNISYDQSLKGFEDLIKKFLPNQIIILSGSKKNILFCNRVVTQFYNSDDYDYLYQQIKLIEILNKSIFYMLNQLEFIQGKTSFSNYQTSIRNKEKNQDYCFEVKLGRIQWHKENAYLILMSDISAIKQVQKLQELDAYKDRLLATVSHDLRTPLNGLIGILDLLYDKIFEKDLRKLIKIANRCSNLLLFMINDILDFSQISNGKLRLNFSKYRIVDLTKEVSALIKFQCNKKNIELIINIPTELNNQILSCDPRRVQQVLLNLISNALKFTEKGYIKLSLKKIIENKKRFIQFSVEDSGLGIKESEKHKLFQLFGKLDLDNPSINPSGVGLGLVISKHLVEMLSGDSNALIEVESQYQKGSVFKFKLPLDIPEDEEINEELFDQEDKVNKLFKSYKFPAKSHNLRILEDISTASMSPRHSVINPPIALKNNRILVVDDDQINLFVVGKYLETFEINYKTACNGKIAYDLVLEEKDFTLILMDCNMPVMNGFESARKIKELVSNKIIEDIPILALTANTTIKDFDQCIQSGMNDYLVKPVSKTQMKEKLQTILKIKIYDKDFITSRIFQSRIF